MANPDDPYANLLSGLVNAITSSLTATSLDDYPFVAANLVYGYVDPQVETNTFPTVSYMIHMSQPNETPGLNPNTSFVVNPDHTTATQSQDWRHYLTMVEFNVWTTNATDRSILCSALHLALDGPTTLVALPNGTNARCIFQKELPFAPEPLRHLYRTSLTYLCKHRMIVTSQQYLVLHTVPTYTVNGKPA